MKTAAANRLSNNCGFTLIEIVVTIIVSAILAVVLAQVMSGQTQRSFWPLQTTGETLLLQRAIENITADHAHLVRYDLAPLVSLQKRVGQAEGRVYWDTATPIQVVDNYCLKLDADGETAKNPQCNASDTLLKITLKLKNQTLTTLFNAY